MHSEIQVDGEKFKTPGNAYHALRELRDPVEPRVLWIDAICIDQQNLEEKQQQILLMKDIYTRASRVVVWLAEPRAKSDLVVSLLDELNAQHDQGTHTFQSLLAIHRPRLGLPEWIALRNFLDHPWWSRIWTLQEVVLASSIVVCFGKHTIPWERLLILAPTNSLLYETHEMFQVMGNESLHSDFAKPLGCGAIASIQWMRRGVQNGVRYSLVELLGQCWERKATDPRDHIFGLFALASDIDELGFAPIYSGSVLEALTNTVKKLLLSYQADMLFSRAGRGFDRCRRLPELPSYVPDWSSPFSIGGLAQFHPGYSQSLIDGQARVAALVSQSDEVGPLRMELFDLDVIEAVGKPFNSQGDNVTTEALLSFFEAAEDLVFNRAQEPYPMATPSRPSISLFEAFWRSTVANSTINRDRVPDDLYYGYLSHKCRLSRDCNKAPTSVFYDLEHYERRSGNDPDHTTAMMLTWWDTAYNLLYHRSFCVTRNGSIGIVPPDTLPGDLVCLLPGGLIPYLMRPKSAQEPNVVELVGECYIHGIAAVEGEEELRSNGTEPRTVTLV
jgi:hypothetical protein